MKVTKLKTPYGVINNPSELVTKMVLRNPYNAKSIVDKSFEKGLQYIKENRARTYQEALNLYIEDKKYNNLLNEVYRTQQEARWSNIK